MIPRGEYLFLDIQNIVILIVVIGVPGAVIYLLKRNHGKWSN